MSESFAELFEKSISSIKEGDVVRGKVLTVDEDHVQIDVGFKSEGFVPTWEFMDEEGRVLVKPGDLAVDYEDHPVDALQDQFPRGVVEGLARNGIEMEACAQSLNGPE